jgi:hypothetical protein
MDTKTTMSKDQKTTTGKVAEPAPQGAKANAAIPPSAGVHHSASSTTKTAMAAEEHKPSSASPAPKMNAADDFPSHDSPAPAQESGIKNKMYGKSGSSAGSS